MQRAIKLTEQGLILAGEDKLPEALGKLEEIQEIERLAFETRLQAADKIILVHLQMKNASGAIETVRQLQSRIPDSYKHDDPRGNPNRLFE